MYQSQRVVKSLLFYLIYTVDTGRIEQISDFLANRKDLINDDFEILLNNGDDETKVEPTSKIMSDLKIKVEELSTNSVKHKLIQISGMYDLN